MPLGFQMKSTLKMELLIVYSKVEAYKCEQDA